MASFISINLLPQEIASDKKNQSRQSFIIKASVGVLALMLIITPVVFFVGISQKLNLNNLNKQVEDVKAKVGSYKDQEGLILTLKLRLDGIVAISGQDSKQSEIFGIISSLLPSDIVITSFEVDKKGKVVLSAVTTNMQSLQTFFNSLVNKDLNKGKINSVSIESLSLGANKQTRMDLVILVK